MKGLYTIIRESNSAAHQAAALKKKPYVFWDEEDARSGQVRLPFIGSFSPPGWQEVAVLLVDSTGFDEDGPAISQKGFIDYVVSNTKEGHGYGYAVIEKGEFQVRVGVFKATEKAHEGTKSEGPRRR